MLMLWGEGDNQILKRLAIVSLYIVSPRFPPLLWHSSHTQYIVYVAPRALFVFFRYSSNRGSIYLFWLCWGLPGCSGRGFSLGAHALLPWWQPSLGTRASRCSRSAAAVPRLLVRAPQLRPMGSAAPRHGPSFRIWSEIEPTSPAPAGGSFYLSRQGSSFSS